MLIDVFIISVCTLMLAIADVTFYLPLRFLVHWLILMQSALRCVLHFLPYSVCVFKN